MKRKQIGNAEQLKLPVGEIGNGGLDDVLLSDLAGLMNITLKEIKDDCYLHEIKKFMSRIAHVNVRFDLPERKLEKLLINADVLNTAEVLVPPVYLPACKKIANVDGIEKKYSVVIDFPFGESAFLTKRISVKDALKKDVKSVTVTLPTVLTSGEKIKEFKKQTKKIGVMANVPIGVALNGSDMTEEQIKTAVKISERTKIDFITFIFGDSSDGFVKERIAFVKKHSGKMKINVLGNINSANTVKELIKLNVNLIYTPFADDIGKEIIERFNVKNVKLV